MSLLIACFILRGLGGHYKERLLLPLTPYILEGEYFLHTAPDLTSCHKWVVSQVIPLMLCGPLIAQIVMSVTRQVVKIGLYMGMTRTVCNRRVFSLGTKQLLQCTFLWYSLVAMYLSAGRFLYILREAVFPLVCYTSISELPLLLLFF